MNNILVPLGSSPDAANLLQYAIDFASDFGANVYLMDVFVVASTAGRLSNVSEKVAASNRERIKKLIDGVETKGLDLKIATYNGDIVDGLQEIKKEMGIDLVVLAAKSNDVNEELYLGNTSGRIIKMTNIPTLIVPKGTKHIPFKNILVAFRSGVLKQSKILHPLISIMNKFKAEVNLLLVKTPGYEEEDLKVNTALLDVSKNLAITENQNTYLGVLAHCQNKQPDLLCVFRRKRGFFKKLWEKNTILKSEFFSQVPVLVLSVKKY